MFCDWLMESLLEFEVGIRYGRLIIVSEWNELVWYWCHTLTVLTGHFKGRIFFCHLRMAQADWLPHPNMKPVVKLRLRRTSRWASSSGAVRRCGFVLARRPSLQQTSGEVSILHHSPMSHTIIWSLRHLCLENTVRRAEEHSEEMWSYLYSELFRGRKAFNTLSPKANRLSGEIMLKWTSGSVLICMLIVFTYSTSLFSVVCFLITT